MNDLVIKNFVGVGVAITDNDIVVIMDNYGHLRIFEMEPSTPRYRSMRLFEICGRGNDFTVLSDGKIFERKIDSIGYDILLSLELHTRSTGNE